MLGPGYNVEASVVTGTNPATGATSSSGVQVAVPLSWYPTKVWRFEFDYGYGRLQRFGTTGLTRFYQLRLQFEI